jgi:hypothetical protein
MRHLRRYLEILPTRQEAEHEPELFAHVARTRQADGRDRPIRSGLAVRMRIELQ